MVQKTDNSRLDPIERLTGGNLLAEADSLNNITKYYIHGAGLMAMVTDAGQAYTYHFNAVGSTIAMTDAGQVIVNKYAYDPFGNMSANSIETVPQPFKFVGQHGVMTEPNGFYYMRARYYDPEVGRFISEDPSGFEGGDTNLCAYAGNNPVNKNDPSGEIAPAVIGAYAGLTAIAAGFINWWYWATHPETTDPTPPKVGSRPIEVKPGPPPTRPVPAACRGK